MFGETRERLILNGRYSIDLQVESSVSGSIGTKTVCFDAKEACRLTPAHHMM